jgi:hypothetical protein
MKFISKNISLIVAATICIALPLAFAECGICLNGTMVDPYQGFLPSFGNETTGMTCEEYDTYLQSLPEEECFDAKSAWKIDVEFLCGCEGSQLYTSIEGGCSVCDAGDRIDDPDNKTITGGYPLVGQLDSAGNLVPITCGYVFDIVPTVKYLKTCEEFQNWYGAGVCCTAGTATTEPPSIAPTKVSTSLASSISGVAGVFIAVVGSIAAIW